MIRRFVDHPVATWMLFAALVFMGLYALPRLEIEAMPDTELPTLSVTTTWIGASPSAVLRSLTLPIEEAARKVYGVEGVTSSSRPGWSQVTVEFRRDVNLEFAQLELAEQLGAVRADLPATATQPRVVPEVPEEFRTDDFMTISLISDLSANDLRDTAETWLLPRLLAVPGVADVELQGGALPLVKVLLDFELMERYAIHADEVYAAIDVLDDILPAGGVRRRGLEIAVSVQDSVTARNDPGHRGGDPRRPADRPVAARRAGAVVRRPHPLRAHQRAQRDPGLGRQAQRHQRHLRQPRRARGPAADPRRHALPRRLRDRHRQRRGAARTRCGSWSTARWRSWCCCSCCWRPRCAACA